MRPSWRARRVRSPSLRSGWSWEVQEGLGVPPRGPGEVMRPSQRFGRDQKALPKVRGRSRGPLTHQEGLGGPPKGRETLSEGQE